MVLSSGLECYCIASKVKKHVPTDLAGHRSYIVRVRVVGSGRNFIPVSGTTGVR